MSVTGEIELAKGSIDLFQSAVDDLINRYGRGVRPAWVNDDLEALYHSIRRAETRMAALQVVHKSNTAKE
tara:strand:- start:811 stop:1020 length:210 start_codon:yes stop_codon:yes gene_type:complete